MANEVPAQIDYTSRDYQALIEDLVGLVNVRTNYAWAADDVNDLGTSLLESFAYMGDIMSYYIDRVANELTIDTAARRKTLVDIGKLYGYRISGPTPARVSVTFENISDAPLDIPVGTQVLATLLYGDFTEIYFETLTNATQLAPGDVVTLLCQEGKTVNTDRPDLVSVTTNKPLPVNLGTSDGTANQIVIVVDSNIVDNSIVVYVGQGVAFTPWSFIDSLTEASPNSLVFTTSIDVDGLTSIEFGDGINGAIPPANQVISALYRTSAGVAGNLNSGSIEEITFIPGNNIPEAIGFLSVTNTTASYGGADGDDNDQIREKIKNAITTRRRAVTLNDYAALATQVSSVGRAKAIAAVYSSVTLYLQSQNDDSITPGTLLGSPTTAWTALAANVATYLDDKMPVGTTVSIQPPTYVDFYVDLTVTSKPAYRNEDVKQNIQDAFLNAGGLFSYEAVDFGQKIAYSAVMAKAALVEGVDSILITKLNIDNGGSASTSGIQLVNGQIPVLQTVNLNITVTGGLS
jgi:uncharacterized phage protein gp47/JayE